MDEKGRIEHIGDGNDAGQDGFIELARDLSPLDAQILLGRLQADGIEAHLSGNEAVQAIPHYRQAFGGARIFVRARQYIEASHIVASLDGGDYQLESPEEASSPQPDIRTKRWFGWVVVMALTIICGGLALWAIWSPSYNYFPYSMTPEPMAHIVGKWVLSALILAPAAFWLFFVEASLRRKTKR